MTVIWSGEQLTTAGIAAGISPIMDTERLEGTDRLHEARTFLEIANRHHEYRWPDKAKSFARRALTIFERELGPHDPIIAKVLVCLAGAQKDRGEYETAEAHHLRAAAILNRLPDGSGDPEIARLRVQAARGLADVLCALGRYCEAEPMLKQALAMSERTFGRQSVDTAAVLNDLAVFYKYTGRFEKALHVLREALAIVENVAGPNHPLIATILNSLAVLHLVQGRFWQGEPSARRSVKVREQTLGPDHPQVAADIVTLAAILDGQGEYAEAESHYRRALTMFERWFGPDHYEVAMTLTRLAALLRSQGRLAEAEPMYFRALRIFERPQGPAPSELAAREVRCA